MHWVRHYRQCTPHMYQNILSSPRIACSPRPWLRSRCLVEAVALRDGCPAALRPNPPVQHEHRALHHGAQGQPLKGV